MQIDKQELLETIIAELEQQRIIALKAVDQAHESATHEENIAENKYDTLGLEAAYLAHGQSMRVAELEQDIINFNRLPIRSSFEDEAIGLGSVIELCDQEEKSNWYFLAPSSGGLKVKYKNIEITLITNSSPLGALLVDKFSGDEIKQIGTGKYLTINTVC